MLYSKKAITGIVATAFLIVVTVVSITFFQGWLGSYQTGLVSEIESNSNSQFFDRVKIENIVCPNLYIFNDFEENILVNDVKIDSKSCNISQELNSKVSTIDLTNCLEDLSLHPGDYDVVVYSDNKIVEKTLYFHSSCFIKNPT